MYFFQQAIDRSQQPQESVTNPITIRTSAGTHIIIIQQLSDVVCFLATCMYCNCIFIINFAADSQPKSSGPDSQGMVIHCMCMSVLQSYCTHGS